MHEAYSMTLICNNNYVEGDRWSEELTNRVGFYLLEEMREMREHNKRYERVESQYNCINILE